MLFSHPHADVVLIARNHHLVVCNTRGDHLSPVIPRSVDASSKVALGVASRLLCIGVFESGHVEAIDWCTGNARWQTQVFRRLHRLHAFGQHVIAESLDHQAALLDGNSGTVLASANKFKTIECDPRGDALLIHRDKLEFHRSLDTPPVARFNIDQPIHMAAFLDTETVIAQPNGLIRLLEIGSSRERWRFDCGPGSLAGAIGVRAGEESIFAIRFNRDREHEPESMLISAADGTPLKTAPTPNIISHPVFANHYRLALTQHWRCDTSTLLWSPWDTNAILPPMPSQ